jgi:hypothetical protein
MGADGRRPVSGGASYGSRELKRKAGKSFSLHVEASAGEGAAGKTTVAEIRRRWPASTGGGDELD